MAQGGNATTGTKRAERTCIVCRTSLPKTELLRIVRTPQGSVEFDRTGRAAGRGAYVCSRACLERATRGERLSRALKHTVSQHDIERIAGELADLLGDA